MDEDSLRTRGLELLGLADSPENGSTTCVSCGAACLDADGLSVLCGVCVSRVKNQGRTRTWTRRPQTD